MAIIGGTTWRDILKVMDGWPDSDSVRSAKKWINENRHTEPLPCWVDQPYDGEDTVAMQWNDLSEEIGTRTMEFRDGAAFTTTEFNHEGKVIMPAVGPVNLSPGKTYTIPEGTKIT